MEQKIEYIYNAFASIAGGYAESLTVGEIRLSDRTQGLELIISKSKSVAERKLLKVKVIQGAAEMSIDLSAETVKDICVNSGLMNESLEMKLDILMDRPIVLNINGKEYTIG